MDGFLHHQRRHEENHSRKKFRVINPNEHSWTDNSIQDFYDNWSIDATCDTVTLESRHPIKPPKFDYDQQMFYTYECKDDEIAYFKVNVNLISSLPYTYLGNVWNVWFLNTPRPIWRINLKLILKELTPRFSKFSNIRKYFMPSWLASEKCINWEFEFIGTIGGWEIQSEISFCCVELLSGNSVGQYETPIFWTI